MTAAADDGRTDAAGAGDRPLTVPLLVRGGLDPNTQRELVIIARLSALMAVVTIICGIVGAPGLLVLMQFTFAAGFGSLALGIFLWYHTRRRWLEVTLTGIVLTQRGQKIPVRDEQVIAVSRQRKIVPPGFFERVVRLEIDREGAVETIESCYSLVRGQIDPLDALLNRLFRSLAHRTREGLSRGAALSGKGWRVDRDGLHCVVGRMRSIYPLECLARVSRHGGCLCLWKGIEERPFLCIPLGSRNAYPLEIFLQQSNLANRARVQELPGKPLGRMLLRHHNPDRGRGLAVAAGALVVTAFLIMMGLPPVTTFWQLGCLLLGALTVCIAPLGVLAFLRSNRPTIHFHEAGVSLPRRDGVRELLYTDVETMTLKNGQEILFTPKAGSNRPIIHYRSVYGRATNELLRYRDQAACVIAHRWRAELANGPVTWTPRLRFLPDGLEYRPESAMGTGEPRTVPYDKISYQVEQGHFLLLVKGQSAPVAKERLDGVNVFPGLMLLRMIDEHSQPSDAGTDAKTLAARWDTLRAATPEKTTREPNVRITVDGASSRAITTEVPDLGEPGEDDE